MTKEEKKTLEDAAQAAREKADKAHAAAAEAGGADEALNKAAEDAEEKANEAQAVADAAVVDSEAEATPEGEEGDKDIDFEKELQDLEGQPPQVKKDAQTELEKARKALFFNSKRFKELGGDPTEVLKEVTPVVEPHVQPPADAPSNVVTREDLVEIEAAKYAKTEAERKVIMHHYRNSIKISGNILADLENAYLIAHKGRISRSFSEIHRSSFSRPSAPVRPGVKPPAQPTKAPELSKTEAGTLERRGFKRQPDGSWESKRYKMTFDVKKKGWVTEKKA